jgi:hypothetical protein
LRDYVDVDHGCRPDVLGVRNDLSDGDPVQRGNELHTELLDSEHQHDDVYPDMAKHDDLGKYLHGAG